jgi:hypothetical protein
LGEKLGLALENGTAPVTDWVVDRVEMPEEN